MSDTRKQQPSPKDSGVGARGRREARLAAALRANLARRKTQDRQRAAAPSVAATAKPEERG
jgi:hypothetical protein